MIDRFMFWLRTRIKKKEWGCVHNCMTCKHYFICRVDFETTFKKRER